MSALDDLIAANEAPAAPPAVAPAVADPVGSPMPALSTPSASPIDPATGQPWAVAVQTAPLQVQVYGTSADGFKSGQKDKPEDFKAGGALDALIKQNEASPQMPDPAAPPAPLIAQPPSAADRLAAVQYNPDAAPITPGGPDLVGSAGAAMASGMADIGNTIGRAFSPKNTGIDLSANLPRKADGSADIAALFKPNGQPTPSLSSLIVPPAPSPAQKALDDQQAALDQFNAEQTAKAPLLFPAVRLATNVAATAPLVASGGGGALVSRALAPEVGPMLPGAISRLSGVAKYAAPLADNAIGAYTSAKAVDPNASAWNLLAGAAAPVLFRGGAAGAGLVSKAAANVFASPEAQAANFVLRAGGNTADDIPWLRSQLAANTHDAAGVPLTSAQALYSPANNGSTAGLSQLERNLPADPSMLAARSAQTSARHGVLNALEPNTRSTPGELAESFGSRAGPSIRAQRAAAREATSQAFDNVDNFNETAFHLPIDRMRAAIRRFLPPGTVGMGGKANAILKEAETIGQTEVPAIKPVAPGKVTPAEKTLAQKVRAAGGIRADNESGKAFGGELEALRQTGAQGLVRKGSGVDIDKLAEILHAQGHIPDNDPATLIAHLVDGESASSYGHEADMDALYRHAMESAQGEEGTAARTIPKAIGFNSTQALRASIGNFMRDIEAKSGRNPEWAALNAMREALDEHVGEVAAGAGAPGEVFPADNVQQWMKARQLKIDEVNRFGGPVTKQATRVGSEAQDGNLAQKFYGVGPTKGATMEDFAHIESPELRQALRAYAVEGMRREQTQLGHLTPALAEHLDARSVANRHLFTPEELSRLDALTAGIQRTTEADKLGVIAGSPTAQYLQTMGKQGLIPRGAALANLGGVPIIGGIVKNAAQAATDRETARVGRLMADPAALRAALPAAAALAARNAQPLIGNTTLAAERLGVRALPLIGQRAMN